MFRFSLCCFSIALTICFSPLHALGEPQDEQPLQNDYFDLDLEELMKIEVVTVTARKQEENLQDVPGSLSTLQGDILDVVRSSSSDIRHLNARVPSFTIESSFGRTFPRMYIRGLGNTDFDLNASQPVSVVVDEVVNENPILKGFPVFDMNRVEVLRGPQGSLFGRNTPAGVVKFETNRPVDRLEGYAHASYGTDNTVELEGVVNDQLSDTVTARFSLLRQQKSDYLDNHALGFEEQNTLGGYHETAGRFQVLITPDEDFEALVNYHFRNLEGHAGIFRANIIQPGTNNFIPGFDRDDLFQDAIRQNREDLFSHGGHIRLEYEGDQHIWTSISALESVDYIAHGDIDGGYGAAFLPAGLSGPGVIPFPSETADGIPDHWQFTQELRLANKPEGRLGYQAGLFYFHEDLTVDSFSFDTFSGNIQNGFAQQEQETNAAALFGTVSYNVTDDLQITGGARFSYDEKDFRAQRYVSPSGGGVLGPLTANPDDSHVSWDLSALYDYSDTMNFYARIANGFRSPSVQGRILFGDEITIGDSEEVLSFETGLKSDFWNERARLNASVYYFTMDDQQLTAVGGDSNFNRLVNANETMGYGAELDAAFAVTPSFYLTASASYNHTELNDSQLSIPACAQCTILDPTNSHGFAVIDGNRLPFAPEWITNLNARYTFKLDSGELYILTDWVYRSEYNFFLYDSAEFKSEFLLEGGVRAGYRWSGDSADYEIALFVRNITDQESLIGGIDFNNLTGIVNEGRFWGAQLRANFS